MRLQVAPKLFGVDSCIPQMIMKRLPGCWAWQSKMCGSQRCYSELVKLTVEWVDDIWRCRCLWLGTSETGTQWSARHLGALCRRQWWTVTASLYCSCRGIS